MSEFFYAVVFYLIAAVILFAALGVVGKKNLVHSALLMTVAFIGVGALYLLLNADFLAAVQILVYAGAVAVMITLGVMLTKRESMAESNPDHGNKWIALFVTGLFGIIMCAVIVATPWQTTVNSFSDTVGSLADLMLGQYVIAFETAAVLLLAAMIGAIIMAKGADEG